MRLPLRPFGHVAAHDALGQALDDRGLADAGLADQHRVVLGAAREDLDDAADLLVAADDRVELALLGERGEVAAVLLERLVGALGRRARHALAAPHGRGRLEQLVVGEAGRAERLGHRAVLELGERQQHVLHADELVLHALGLGLGRRAGPRRRAGRCRPGRLAPRARRRGAACPAPAAGAGISVAGLTPAFSTTRAATPPSWPAAPGPGARPRSATGRGAARGSAPGGSPPGPSRSTGSGSMSLSPRGSVCAWRLGAARASSALQPLDPLDQVHDDRGARRGSRRRSRRRRSIRRSRAAVAAVKAPGSGPLGSTSPRRTRRASRAG